MQLKDTARTILNQIFNLVNQLSDEEYKAQLDLLSGNSIGKHVRHVVEFFDLLVSGASEQLINYDKRKHEPVYEENTALTNQHIQTIIERIEKLESNSDVFLEVSYAESDKDSVKIKSSLEREIAYNIEHAIHHMAIIKIAVMTVFPKLKLAKNFGIAYSTVRYQKAGSN